MTRFAAAFAFLVTGALMAVVAMGRMGTDWDGPHLVGASNVNVADLVTSYRCFKTTFENTASMLVSGEIRLPEASASVYEAALHNNPRYLKHIQNSDPDVSARRRIARNLIGHVRNLQEIDPSLEARVHALEAELADVQ